VPSSRGGMKKPRWTGAKMAYGHQEDRCSPANRVLSYSRFVRQTTDGAVSAPHTEGRDRLSPRFCGGAKESVGRGALLGHLPALGFGLEYVGGGL
jgi:hypothetical protein